MVRLGFWLFARCGGCDRSDLEAGRSRVTNPRAPSRSLLSGDALSVSAQLARVSDPRLSIWWWFFWSRAHQSAMVSCIGRGARPDVPVL